MPLNFFDNSDNSSAGQLEFLDDWIAKNPKNKETLFSVNEVKRVQSGKGYLLSTDSFLVFAWKNQKVTKLLIEALDYYVQNPDSGYEIFVVLTKPNKSDYQLAADSDKPTTWFTSKNGYTTTEPDVPLDTNTQPGNPLLIKK